MDRLGHKSIRIHTYCIYAVVCKSTFFIPNDMKRISRYQRPPSSQKWKFCGKAPAGQARLLAFVERSHEVKL